MKHRAPLFVLLFAALLLIWFVQSESAAPTAALELDGDLLATEAGLAAASGLRNDSAPLGGREQDSRRQAADSEEKTQERGREGGLRLLSELEFLQRLRELGVDPRTDFSEPQDPELGSLFVLITSTDDEAVARARATVDANTPDALAHHVRDGQFSPDARQATSSRRGVAQLANLDPGAYLLAVDHEDFLTRYFASTEVRRGERSYVEAVLQRSDAIIAGRVQDTVGAPIAGVAISAARYQEGGIPFVFSASTGYDGSFEVGVEKGTQNLVVASALGYREERLQNVPAGKTDLVIVLEFSGTVRVTGFVTVGDSTEPVTSFAIDGQGVQHPEGRFSVERNISAEPVSMTFSAEGFQARTMSLDLSEPRDVDVGQVALYGKADLQGIVLLLQGEDTLPVADAQVTVTPAEGEAKTMMTASDGLFAFAGLEATSATLAVLWAEAAPYSRDLVLSAEEPTFVEVILDGGEYEVQGLVLDDSNEEPIADARIEVLERPDLFALSGEDGRYSISGIADSPFQLKVSAVGYKDETSPPIVGTLEATVWDARMLASGVRVQLSTTGSPAPGGVEVTLWKAITPQLAAAQAAQAALETNSWAGTSDADGRVTFDVEPGNYFLSSPSHRLHPMAVQALEESAAWIDVALPGTALVEGQVLNADGSPVANTTLWLHSGDQDYSTMFLYHTDNSGAYQIPNLAPRPYALSIIKSSTDQSAQFVREFQPAGSASQSLNVQLPPLTASIHGQLVDELGAGVAGVQIGVEFLDAQHRSILAGWVGTAADGTYEVPHLEAGRHRVRTSWTTNEAVFSDVITLTNGEQREVNLVMPSQVGRHVSGTMIASDGGPLGGSFVFASNANGEQNGNFFSSMAWGYAGSFDIGGLAPGPHQITLTAMGCVQKTLQVQVNGDVAGLVVVMERETN